MLFTLFSGSGPFLRHWRCSSTKAEKTSIWTCVLQHHPDGAHFKVFDIQHKHQLRQAKCQASFSSPVVTRDPVHSEQQSLWRLSDFGNGTSKKTKGRRTTSREWQRGKWRAPVVSRSTSRLIRVWFSNKYDDDDDDVWGRLSETEHTADKVSYILCLFKFNPPNPKATTPTNQRKRSLGTTISWWDVKLLITNSSTLL